MARKYKSPIGYKIRIGRTVITVSPEQYNQVSRHKSLKDCWFGDIVNDDEPIYESDALKFSDESKIKAFMKLIPPAVKKLVQKEKQEDAKYEKQRKVRAAAEKKSMAALVKKYPLPEAITIDDLVQDGKRLDYNDPAMKQLKTIVANSWDSFDIWYTERFGWVVPSLIINAKNRNGTYRAYATIIKTGALCRVGHGPHVLATFKVYINKKNHKRIFKKYMDILTEGAQSAHDCRDRISTKRARSKGRSFCFDRWDF